MGEKGNLEPATVVAAAGPGAVEQVGNLAQTGGTKLADATADAAAAAVVGGATAAIAGKDDDKDDEGDAKA